MAKGKGPHGEMVGIFKYNAFNCQITAECQNNQCFYRQRDHLGLPVWHTADPDGVKTKKVIEQYGDTIFPNIIVTHVTNCMAIHCMDAMVV